MFELSAHYSEKSIYCTVNGGTVNIGLTVVRSLEAIMVNFPGPKFSLPTKLHVEQDGDWSRFLQHSLQLYSQRNRHRVRGEDRQQ